MKIFIAVLIILLTSCSYKEKNNENISANNIKIEHQNIEEDVGYAFTIIYDKSENRLTNINLACTYASGKKLEPNEEFSFNDIVGERSRIKGFKDASVLVSGESRLGTGGGVCQVSSTIHMAAVNAGLEIKERHSHSKNIIYAPYGLDAAVVYGEKDFRFINNTNEPIYIYVWTDNEKIYSKIIKKY